MWKVTFKGLLAHRIRLTLTALAVVLGVGFVSGTFILTDTMSRVFDDLVTGGVETGDVYVRGETGMDALGTEGSYYESPGLPAALLDAVRSVDGVAEVAGSVEGYGQIITPTGEAVAPTGPPTFGVSWLDPPLGNRVVLDGGRTPTAPDEVVVDERTAERWDLAVGDEVRVVFTAVEPRTFTIVGVSTVPGGDNLAGATLAEFELTTAQEVLGRAGEFTSIAVTAVDGLTSEELAARLSRILPAGVEAITAEAFQDEILAQIGEVLGYFTLVLGAFGAIALFVGGFLIANTFAIVVVQRTRELALLRALGASRRQVVGSLLGEAAMVGVAASVIGIPAGAGLAVGLRQLLAAFGMDLPAGGLVVQPRTVVLALAVGVGVTVLSASLPARRAARVHPIDALREAGIPTYHVSRRRAVAGLGTLVLSAGVVAYALVAAPGNDLLLVGLAAGLAVVAVMAVGPGLTRPLVRAVGGAGTRFGPVARLARGNVLRTPRRTWATASALMIGLALVSCVAVLAASLKASITLALDETLRADLVVSTQGGAMAMGGMPRVVGEQIRAVEEVGALSPLRITAAEVDGADVMLTAIDPDTWEQVAHLELVAGDLATATDGTVLVDTQLARSAGYRIGDEVAARFPATGATSLRVAGIFEPDQVLSGWIVSTGTYDRHVTHGLDAALLIVGADGVTSNTLRSAVEATTEAYPTLQVQDQAQYRDRVAGQIDQLLALVIALLGMALLIAVLGIINTLALSVHERTREIGLLRAVGMTRSQVRSMIRWEAVTIALLGAATGLLLGTVFAGAMLGTLADEGMTAFVVPVGQLLTYVVVAAAAGVLAAVLPARSAARLDVLRAVTVE